MPPSLPDNLLDSVGYWREKYGVETFGEFATKLRPAFSWLWASPMLDATLLLAYEAYGSLPFNQAVSWASRNLAPDPPSTSSQSVVDALQAALTPLIGVPLMSQLIVPNCFQVAICGSSGGQSVINVVGVQNAGGTALGAAQAVQTAWKVASGPLVALSSLYTMVEFRSMDIGSANGAIATVADTTLGGATGSGLSTNAASALVKWNGGTRSKSSRGRLYYGPLAETQINSDGRTIATASRTQFQTAFNNFRASLSTQGYPLVVLSRKLSQAFTVTSSDVETVIATQRRRIRS